MIFADLAAGEAVFVDANTLIYHFCPHPIFGTACRQLIQRIESQDLVGFTSTHTLGEVAHQLMIVEALTFPGWSAGKVKKREERKGGGTRNSCVVRGYATATAPAARLTRGAKHRSNA